MKYEITDFAHPKYPWLHRIRALIDVNEKVPKGSLGGYVQSESNLSQEGECWIYNQAICCEDAVAEERAGMFDGSIACGAALLTGDAVMYERAMADGNCCIRSGEIKEEAQVTGYAIIREDPDTKCSPLIFGCSRVYGTVSGNFMIKGNVLPGENLMNPTKDIFILEDGKWTVLAETKKLHPPEQENQQEQSATTKKKKNQPMR